MAIDPSLHLVRLVSNPEQAAERGIGFEEYTGVELMAEGPGEGEQTPFTIHAGQDEWLTDQEYKAVQDAAEAGSIPYSLSLAKVTKAEEKEARTAVAQAEAARLAAMTEAGTEPETAPEVQAEEEPEAEAET